MRKLSLLLTVGVITATCWAEPEMPHESTTQRKRTSIPRRNQDFDFKRDCRLSKVDIDSLKSHPATQSLPKMVFELEPRKTVMPVLQTWFNDLLRQYSADTSLSEREVEKKIQETMKDVDAFRDWTYATEAALEKERSDPDNKVNKEISDLNAKTRDAKTAASEYRKAKNLPPILEHFRKTLDDPYRSLFAKIAMLDIERQRLREKIREIENNEDELYAFRFLAAGRVASNALYEKKEKIRDQLIEVNAEREQLDKKSDYLYELEITNLDDADFRGPGLKLLEKRFNSTVFNWLLKNKEQILLEAEASQTEDKAFWKRVNNNQRYEELDAKRTPKGRATDLIIEDLLLNPTFLPLLASFKFQKTENTPRLLLPLSYQLFIGKRKVPQDTGGLRGLFENVVNPAPGMVRVSSNDEGRNEAKEYFEGSRVPVSAETIVCAKNPYLNSYY